MSELSRLERRYRRLLVWYPAGHRRTHAEEMIGVLLASAADGQEHPRLAESADLIRGGLQIRLRSASARFLDINWRDALALYSLAFPVLVLSNSIARDWQITPARLVGDLEFSPWPTLELSVLPVAIAILAPLIALHYRRPAAILALAGVACYASVMIDILWAYGVISAMSVSCSLAFGIEAIALAISPGPRRGLRMLRPKSWIILSGSGIAGWLIVYHYFTGEPTWVAATVLLVTLAAGAAGMLWTTDEPVTLGLIALMAVPAYPWTLWAIGMTGMLSRPMQPAAFLPTLLLAGLVATAVKQSRRRSKRSASHSG